MGEQVDIVAVEPRRDRELVAAEEGVTIAADEGAARRKADLLAGLRNQSPIRLKNKAAQEWCALRIGAALFRTEADRAGAAEAAVTPVGDQHIVGNAVAAAGIAVHRDQRIFEPFAGGRVGC